MLRSLAPLTGRQDYKRSARPHSPKKPRYDIEYGPSTIYRGRPVSVEIESDSLIMFLSDAFAAPKILWIGTDAYYISPPSLRGYAMIYGYLDSVISPPEDMMGNTPAEGDWSPDLSDPESVKVLSEGVGLGVLLHVVMMRDNPEIRLNQSIDLVELLSLDSDESRRVQEMALVRTRREPDNIAHWKGSKAPEKEGTPLNRANFGRLLEFSRIARFDPNVVGTWTLSQLENKLSGGGEGSGGSGDIDSSGNRKAPLPDGSAPLSESEVLAFAARMRDPHEAMKVAVMRGEAPPEWVLKALAVKPDGPGGPVRFADDFVARTIIEKTISERRLAASSDVAAHRSLSPNLASNPPTIIGRPNGGGGEDDGGGDMSDSDSINDMDEGMRIIPNNNPNPIPGVLPPNLPELMP